MKKSVILIACITILMNLCSFSAFAASTVDITVGSGTGEMGDTVEIPVVIANNTGFSSLGIEIGYDETALKLTNVVAGNVGTSYMPAQNYTVNPYNLSWNSAFDTTFNGTLATLTFEIITSKSGSYPVTVDYYKGPEGNFTEGEDVNFDQDFEALNMNYINGSVTVEGSSVTPGISVGGISFDVALTADEFTGDIYAALYDNNNCMKSIKVYPASENVKVSFAPGETGSYVKIMWWNSGDTMIPVCEASTIPLQ